MLAMPMPRECPSTPRGVEQQADSTGKSTVRNQSGAESGALGAQNAPADPDLARVVAAWPRLPEPMRRAILALIDAAGEA